MARVTWVSALGPSIPYQDTSCMQVLLCWSKVYTLDHFIICALDSRFAHRKCQDRCNSAVTYPAPSRIQVTEVKLGTEASLGTGRSVITLWDSKAGFSPIFRFYSGCEVEQRGALKNVLEAA